MPDLKFYVRKNTFPAPIYARFMAFEYDIWGETKLLIDPRFWNSKTHRLRNTKEYPDAFEINNKLDKLKPFVFDEYTKAITIGASIDKMWLNKSIMRAFNRPVHEIENIRDTTAIYFSHFAEWWTKNEMPTYRNPKSRKLISAKRQKTYLNFVKLIKRFEKEKKYKIHLAKMSPKFSDKLMTYFDAEMNYGSATVGKFIAKYNFLCERAIENNRTLPRNYKCIYVPTKQKDVLEPYLSLDEIEKIYRFDLEHDPKLDHVRDNFIIGLCTGLRVSDFLGSLNVENINNGFIEIKTQKTKTPVAIPVHWMVQEILNKRFNNFPEKISDQKFNRHIKTICKDVGINEEIEGYLYDTQTKRNKLGRYPKWMLVSSHICRRSFATNLYGEVPNNVIQQIGGWSTEVMMLKYMKKTNHESAKQLEEYWKKKKQFKNI